MELEVSPGVYGAPEDDSYGVDFAAETLNQATPGVRVIPGCGRPYGGLLWEEGPFQGRSLARTGYSSYSGHHHNPHLDGMPHHLEG